MARSFMDSFIAQLLMTRQQASYKRGVNILIWESTISSTSVCSFQWLWVPATLTNSRNFSTAKKTLIKAVALLWLATIWRHRGTKQAACVQTLRKKWEWACVLNHRRQGISICFRHNFPSQMCDLQQRRRMRCWLSLTTIWYTTGAFA